MLSRLVWNKLQNSLLLRLGGMVGAITMLAVVSMSVSWMVAETTQGSGKAINVAGSLRMQSWRIALVYHRTLQQGSPELKAELQRAITRFENDLKAESILLVMTDDETTPLNRAYRWVVADWFTQIKPALNRSPSSASTMPAVPDVLDQIPDFVSRINELVSRIEEAAEAKIRVLRVILGAAVIGTILLVALSIYLVNNILVKPLRDLLELTDRIGQGNLAARTDLRGEDEIGRLGQAFNIMAEDLSKLYQNLEARVEEKTAKLTIANRSLELLYHSISRLYGGPVSPSTYSVLLRDLESVLGFGHSQACLVETGENHARVVASTFRPEQHDVDMCGLMSCAECLSHRSLGLHALKDGSQVLSLPLKDAENQYGVLQMEVPSGRELEEWQRQLLEALTRHIGIAIGTARSAEQSRRLSLLEERAAIARELHDSLAQSLAYMKIQVSRLKPYMEPSGDEALQVLNELREGLNSAYRQLRELLTTFRLRIEEEGLNAALKNTVAEFSERGGIPITLDLRLAGCHLTANEEVHTLQIVREALSNVLNHAHAEHASVKVAYGDDGFVNAVIEDDGVGIRQTAGAHHYGITIMEERAKNLGGTLTIYNPLPSGTRVSLHFTPSSHQARPDVSPSGFAA